MKLKQFLVLALMFTASFVFGSQLPEYDVGPEVAKIYVNADDVAHTSIEVATIDMHTLKVSSAYVPGVKVFVSAFKHQTGVVLQTVIEDCEHLYFTGIGNTEKRLTHYEPTQSTNQFDAIFKPYDLKHKTCILQKDKYLFTSGGMPYLC